MKSPNAVRRGVRSPFAKLTDAAVQEIRALRQAGISYQALANRFGVSSTTISRIVDGTAWRHVPQQPVEKHICEGVAYKVWYRCTICGHEWSTDPPDHRSDPLWKLMYPVKA